MRTLLRYTVVILFTAPFIGWMLFRAWGPQTAAFELLRAFKTAVGLPAGVAGTEAIASFGLGLYFSLLAIFASDVRKRFQGILILAGSVIALAVMAYLGVLLPNLDPTRAINWAGLISGVILGSLIEYQTLGQVNPETSTLGHAKTETGKSVEFKNATYALFGVIAAIIIVGLVQAYVAGRLFPLDPIAVFAFVVVLYWFIGYNSSHTFQVLGPKQSGKSMFLLGLFLERVQRNSDQEMELPPNPNDGMKSMLSKLEGYDPEEDGWPTAANPVGERGLNRIWFGFTAGSMFPVHVVMSAIDHGGEHLRDIADRIRPNQPMTDGGPGISEESDSSDIYDYDDDSTTTDGSDNGIELTEGLDLSQEDDSDEDSAISMDEFYTQVVTTDTLILLIDCERAVRPDDKTAFNDASLQTDHLDTIVQNTTERKVVLVATKADFLFDRFRYNGYDYELATDPDGFEDFRDFVTDELRSIDSIQYLIQDAQVSEIHPVFFVTKEHNGRRVPELDPNGNLQGVGYDRVLEVLEEEV